MKKTEKASVKIAEKTIVRIAELFSTVACSGRFYEPKLPEKLRK